MAFSDFTFPRVQEDLGLTADEADLFAAVPPLPLRPELLAELADNVQLAVAVFTEKARSEFIVAPLLLELRRLTGRRFGLFSGVELEGDPALGLVGVCDFLITRSPRQMIVTAPVLAIVEAKSDNLRSGVGPCIAAVRAAQLFNERTNAAVPAVYGGVTTGSDWRFLRLVGDNVTLDAREYQIGDPGRIMGILRHIVEHP